MNASIGYKMLRRTLLPVGLALLVGGWGMTRYADEQQQIFTMEHARRAKLWIDGELSQAFALTASSKIYRNGVISMACGALLVGFGLPWSSKN